MTSCRPLIWWALPKNELQQKKAERVTMSDLAYYFALIGYFNDLSGLPTDKKTENLAGLGESGGDERTLRRWMRKYTGNFSRWPALRSSLIEIIRRTGYTLP